MKKRSLNKIRYYKTKDYPVGYWGESVVNAVRSAITHHPATAPASEELPTRPPVSSRVRSFIHRNIIQDKYEKTSPSEMVTGLTVDQWKRYGYPSKATQIPAIREKIIIVDRKENNTPEVIRPVNEAERKAWEYQQDRIKRNKRQYELATNMSPGGRSTMEVLGERTTYGFPEEIKGKIELGSEGAHVHPTDLGIQLPTASEADHAAPLNRSESRFSVISPKKIYSGTFPKTVYAPKYQTDQAKIVLWQEGRDELDPDSTRADRKRDLRQGHLLNRMNQFYTRAIDNVVDKHQTFRNDPNVPVLKSLVEKSTDINTVLREKKVQENDPNYKSKLFEVYPTWVSQRHPDKGLQSKLADQLKQNYLDANRRKGITGLTREQDQIVGALRNEETRSFNDLREYVMARNMYSVGGDYRSADITKEDVLNKRPVVFKEVPQKQNAIQDLKREYQVTKVPPQGIAFRQTAKRSPVVRFADRNVINKFEVATTNPNKRVMNRVPITRKLAERAEGSLAHATIKLFGSGPDDPLQDTRGVYKVKPVKKKKGNKDLDNRIDDILFGDLVYEKKKKKER